MKSHFVSQILLRRFTRKKYIGVQAKFKSQISYFKPKNVGFFNISEELILENEQKWNLTETKLSSVFDSLKKGDLLQNEEHVETVKKFMALHFVRSPATMMDLGRKEKEFFQKLIEDLIKEEYGKNINLNAARQNWAKSLRSIFPNIFDGPMEKVLKYIMEQDLEIAVSDKGNEFILGDIPTVNISIDGRLGILQGVGITNSIACIIPLGPNHLASLIKKRATNEYIRLNSLGVARVNEKTIAQSISHYYFKPSEEEVVNYLKSQKYFKK